MAALPFQAAAVIPKSNGVEIETDSVEQAESVLTDGIYNIINKETGKCIEVYDKSADAAGSAFLGDTGNSPAQSFLIRLRDDGTYSIYPQNDNGEYAICYSPDIIESRIITKTKEASLYTEFNFDCVSDNDYVISPAFTLDSSLVLGIASLTTYLGHNYVGLGVFNGSDSQKWELVKVGSESLSMSSSFTTVNVGGTVRIYGSVQPSYLKLDLEWKSSNPKIAKVDSFGRVTGISAGNAVITAKSGDMKTSCTVAVIDSPAFTWYSQHNLYGGGWYASAVGNIKLNSNGYSKPFFLNKPNGNSDWMDQGCKICSIAMVFNNLGATLTRGYDVRTGERDNLVADPFTVVLANLYSDGENLSSSRFYSNPVLAANSVIEPRFTVDGHAIESVSGSRTSKAAIKALLDEHPEGVIVGLSSSRRANKHYVVITGCVNPDAANPNDYEFLICDSATSDPADGNNVKFTESISYQKMGFRYSSIFTTLVYNVID